MWRLISRTLAFTLLVLPLMSMAGGPPDRPGPDADTQHQQIEPGTPDKPGAGERLQRGAQGENCMKVCIRWGEDCITNPQTGTRECRRSCQEFGEQCF